MSKRVLHIGSKIITTAVSAIEEKKGTQILAIEVGVLENAVADFFILCDAANYRQTEAIAHHIEECVRKNCKRKPLHVSDTKNSHWVVMDYNDLIIHIMTKEQRAFYNIEDLWIDVPHLPLGTPQAEQTFDLR